MMKISRYFNIVLFISSFNCVVAMEYNAQDIEKRIFQMTGPNASDEQKWDAALDLEEYEWLKKQIKSKPNFKLMANKTLAEKLENKVKDLKLIEFILELGADPNIYLNNNTPLLYSVISNSKNRPVDEVKDEIKLFLDHGADANLKHKQNKNTILHILAQYNDLLSKNIIKLLFDKSKFKIDIDAKDDFGRTPLFWAVLAYLGTLNMPAHDDMSIIKFLVSKGASPEIQDNHNISVLEYLKSKNFDRYSLDDSINDKYLKKKKFLLNYFTGLNNQK